MEDLRAALEQLEEIAADLGAENKTAQQLTAYQEDLGLAMV